MFFLCVEQSNAGKATPSTTTIPAGPSFSKDFEYLIRHELDKVDSERGPITVQRNRKFSYLCMEKEILCFLKIQYQCLFEIINLLLTPMLK